MEIEFHPIHQIVFVRGSMSWTTWKGVLTLN